MLARGRGVGLVGARRWPAGATSHTVDRRPRQLLITGFLAEEKDELIAHLQVSEPTSSNVTHSFDRVALFDVIVIAKFLGAMRGTSLFTSMVSCPRSCLGMPNGSTWCLLTASFCCVLHIFSFNKQFKPSPKTTGLGLVNLGSNILFVVFD